MAKPILVLDLGSTSTRAFVISSTTFEILGSAKHEVRSLHGVFLMLLRQVTKGEKKERVRNDW